jgi:hypothetical protein
MSNTEYPSNAKLAIPRNSNNNDEIVIILNDIVIEKLERLSIFVRDGFEVNNFRMESSYNFFLWLSYYESCRICEQL